MTRNQAIQASIDRWERARDCENPKQYLLLNPCPLCKYTKCDKCILSGRGICSGLYWKAVDSLNNSNLNIFKLFAQQIIDKLTDILEQEDD